MSKFDLVLIGCSSGGIDALGKILPALPESAPFSVVVLIHLPPQSESLLVEIFSTKCKMPVKEAEDKELINKGKLYFASPDYHLLIEPNQSFSLSLDEPVNFSRPSIDVLFESAAPVYQDKTLGIILTGASGDGAKGLNVIKEFGGLTIVQSPQDAHQSLMPEEALNLNKGHKVMSLSEIAKFFREETDG